MKFSNSILFVFLLLALGLASCSKDDDDNGSSGNPYTGPGCATAWSTELQDEVNAVSQAAQAYANNQSQANCDALKAAYQDYIDELRKYDNCARFTAQQRQDFNESLDEAEDDLQDAC